MKTTRLKNKINNAIKALEQVKNSQGTKLFFEALPDDCKQDYYNTLKAFKILIDNLPLNK